MRRRTSKDIYYKTNDEIELIRQSCLLVGKTHAALVPFIKPGVTTKRLDVLAEEFIRDNQAIPGFKGYNGFPATLCISVNDAVVHGLPSDYQLGEEDVISIDCGVLANGFYGDSAYTYCFKAVSTEVVKLLQVTKESLYKGIEQAVVGKRIGDIGFAIQQYTERINNYGVVRELVGHGVGKNLHEAPDVPNYGRRGDGIKLLQGLVLAIEPMINLGRKEIVGDEDKTTIRTADGKASAHFEHTITIGKQTADILSSFSEIEAALKNNEYLAFV
ncbi:MAG TPA: type I methionyl aminopeptidase [Chitinophagales bacterium]|nr:type I methionyl aminopeptidase [Chitinophagales bacterium]